MTHRITEELLIDGLFETRAQASRELFEFIQLWYKSEATQFDAR